MQGSDSWLPPPKAKDYDEHCTDWISTVIAVGYSDRSEAIRLSCHCG